MGKNDREYWKGYRAAEEEYSVVPWVVFFGCVGAASLICLFNFAGDDGDYVNVRDLGSRLCQNAGLNYSRVTYDIPYYESTPVIHCKNATTQSVYDGVVVLE
jgi:hypothetical protein